MPRINNIFQSGLVWLWVSGLVIAIDRLTKVLAFTNLESYQPLPITRFLNFTLAYNTGAAFSFLNDASGWQLWFFGLLALLVSLILIVYLARTSRAKRWLCIAIALIIGGALGNLWDRISYGYVIDYIDVFLGSWHWPAFNVADSAICIGAFMLIIDALYSDKK